VTHNLAGLAEADARGYVARQRDAIVVAVLAYAGLRPGQLRARRWADVRATTIVVQRAADPDGEVKATAA
jgi:integrase